MSRTVDLVLPDAGPLISLAHADRLDLLDIFVVPVTVLDIVRLECLRKPDAPDHARLAAWFARPGERVRVAPTPFAELYRDALAAERAGTDPVATRGFGDAALSWALSNVDRIARAGALPLVLVEDRKLATRLAGLTKGHILSTRAWLAALDEAGLVDSRSVVADMARRGRYLSDLAQEVPVETDEGPSDWLGVTSRGKREG